MSEKNELSLEILREQDIPVLVETFNFPWTSGEATQEKWEKYYAEQKANIRNKFRRKGYFYPFRGIYLAAGSFSPKRRQKNVQSRDYTRACEIRIIFV